MGTSLPKTLLSYCGSAKDIFNKSKSQLSKIPGIGDYYASKILAFNSFKSAEKEISRCEAHHINLLFCTDPNYPKKLKHAADSPNLLFYKGKGTLNNPKTVAIVGTRNATRYGKEFVAHIVEKLKQHNALIVSGLAYGIDIEAHMCALQNGLSTIGVMASGMDVIYPSMHKKTAKEMMENGGLITESRMGTKPDAHNFPARNRIIAGNV